MVQATSETMDLISSLCGGRLGLAGRRRSLDRYFHCMNSGIRCLLGYVGRLVSVGNGNSDDRGYMLQKRLG